MYVSTAYRGGVAVDHECVLLYHIFHLKNEEKNMTNERTNELKFNAFINILRLNDSESSKSVESEVEWMPSCGGTFFFFFFRGNFFDSPATQMRNRLAIYYDLVLFACFCAGARVCAWCALPQIRSFPFQSDSNSRIVPNAESRRKNPNFVQINNESFDVRAYTLRAYYL